MAYNIQKFIDAAFDAENRLDDDSLITIKVGNLAEFIRHYLAIRTALEKAVDDTKKRILDAEETIEKTKRLLNANSDAPT